MHVDDSIMTTVTYQGAHRRRYRVKEGEGQRQRIIIVNINCKGALRRRSGRIRVRIGALILLL